MEALLRELWQLREIQELAQLMESGGGPAPASALSMLFSRISVLTISVILSVFSI